jgi:hypothetical protein
MFSAMDNRIDVAVRIMRVDHLLKYFTMIYYSQPKAPLITLLSINAAARYIKDKDAIIIKEKMITFLTDSLFLYLIYEMYVPDVQARNTPSISNKTKLKLGKLEFCFKLTANKKQDCAKKIKLLSPKLKIFKIYASVARMKLCKLIFLAIAWPFPIISFKYSDKTSIPIDGGVFSALCGLL